MKKLVDFQHNYNEVKRVVCSDEEFGNLKNEFPGVEFGDISIYPNYRTPSSRGRKSNYVFSTGTSKIAISIEAETEKAYRLQISHISGHTNGLAESRHFKWVAKSLVTIKDGTIYYPFFI